MGRKRIEIDWNVVDDLLSKFCEGTEVAEHLGIHFNTLNNQVKQKFNCGFCDYKAKKEQRARLY